MARSLILVLILALGFQVKGQINSLFLNGEHKVACEGTGLDGSQYVRSFGNGKNKKKAMHQAGKHAIYEILFSGIREGKSGCSVKPLVNTPNARSVHEDYFNKFFADGGKYRKYIKTNDFSGEAIRKYKTANGKLYSVLLTIDIPKLKKELITQGIIPD